MALVGSAHGDMRKVTAGFKATEFGGDMLHYWPENIHETKSSGRIFHAGKTTHSRHSFPKPHFPTSIPLSRIKPCRKGAREGVKPEQKKNPCGFPENHLFGSFAVVHTREPAESTRSCGAVWSPTKLVIARKAA